MDKYDRPVSSFGGITQRTEPEETLNHFQFDDEVTIFVLVRQRSPSLVQST